ncbi:hypothetical protein [Moorena producens]|uniref:hypothetical protein n=1 Tax=Moorena producens TaxID=1155739 RepID=UPI000A906E2B|nr:hypothetical protein [Moorena producens]
MLTFNNTKKTSNSFLLLPVPCSLFPVPCSLLPTPYSLLPTPCSLFPLKPLIS